MRIDKKTIEKMAKEELQKLQEEGPLQKTNRGEEAADIRGGMTKQQQAGQGVQGLSAKELPVASFLRKALDAFRNPKTDLVDGSVLTTAKNFAKSIKKAAEKHGAGLGRPPQEKEEQGVPE